jgi:kynurenine formamidase
MQGAASTGPERTVLCVRTGSAAATPQMTIHGQAPRYSHFQPQRQRTTSSGRVFSSTLAHHAHTRTHIEAPPTVNNQVV